MFKRATHRSAGSCVTRSSNFMPSVGTTSNTLRSSSMERATSSSVPNFHGTVSMAESTRRIAQPPNQKHENALSINPSGSSRTYDARNRGGPRSNALADRGAEVLGEPPEDPLLLTSHRNLPNESLRGLSHF